MKWIREKWMWLVAAIVAVAAAIFRPRGRDWAQEALEDEAQRHAQDAEDARNRARTHEEAAGRAGASADELEAQADAQAARRATPDRDTDWRERHRRITGTD